MHIGLIEVFTSRENSSLETQGQIGKTAAKRKMEKACVFGQFQPHFGGKTEHEVILSLVGRDCLENFLNPCVR